MSFQKTYILVQQTPLIHFQHDQKGATLRATEVKPKLDRFIIKKMGGKGNVPNKWFISDTDALNYKMRIVTEGEPKRSHMADFEIELKSLRDKKRTLDRSSEEYRSLDGKIKARSKERDAEINSMYFGNMVSAKEPNYEAAVREAYKETVFYKERNQIKLIITCFVDGLNKKIGECMEEFFFVTNFGTRQSKGFGGFTAIKLNSEGIEEKGKDPIKTLIDCEYRFFYAEVTGDSTVMLNHAKNVYAVMKGGYNHTGWNEVDKCYNYEKRYIKGYIQREFLDEKFGYKKKGSDKALIKSKKKFAIDKKTNKPYEYHPNRCGKPAEYIFGDENYIFVRAMLGLADYYEFKDVRKGRVDIFGVSVDDNGKKSFGVERFRSPITVKIIGNKLVFLFGDFKPICNKLFYFAPNGIPDKRDFDKKTDDEKLEYIVSTPNVFTKIHTMVKFDDEDILTLINNFVRYFEKEKATLGIFGNNEIRISKNLKLIIPKHIERSF